MIADSVSKAIGVVPGKFDPNRPGFVRLPAGYRQDMSPDQAVTGRAPVPHPEQLSFDELAALRASDEANADAVIAEILALPLDL
jgi:hypothetical protein